MIDPYPQALDRLCALAASERAAAQCGSRFADEARWTADDAAIVALIVEHFATTAEPSYERGWLLTEIAMEIDHTRMFDASDDIRDRTDITDAEVVAAALAYIHAAPDPAQARANIYTMIILERALAGDDAATIAPDLVLGIARQIDTVCTIHAQQAYGARVN